jgi:hypothetical protein
MARFPRTAALFAAASLAFLGALGCVDPRPGDTSKAPIYVFDQTSQTVLAWDDVNALYDKGAGGAAPDPGRTISSAYLTRNGIALGWGGLALNPSSHQLYLVYEDGQVVRIENVTNQNGSLSQIQDIATFSLGDRSSSTDRLSGSVFGQAVIDPSSGTLYVTETGTSGACRIWSVANPGSIAQNGQAPSGTYVKTLLSSDTGGTGIAVGSSGVIGYFTGGDTLQDVQLKSYSGARLRLASGSNFIPNQNVLIGDATLLGDATTSFGTLGYDSTYNRVYVARSFSGGSAVIAFNQSQFTVGSMSQSPALTLSDASATLANLRFITHARTKDWMAGADFVAPSSTGTGTGTNTVRLWKGPSVGAASQACSLPASVTVRGLALDGSQ